MILGHLSATYLAVKAMRKEPNWLVTSSALVGAFLPDIIDKGSVRFLAMGSERGIGHTLLFQLALALTAIGLCRIIPRYAASIWWFVWGSTLHLIEDCVTLPVLLWPLLGSLPRPHHHDFWEMVWIFYIERRNLPVFVFEMVSHAILVVYLARAFHLRRATKFSRSLGAGQGATI